MNPFEKFFSSKKIEDDVPEKIEETKNDEQAIKSSHDFMEAIYADRLSEAEAYLMQEKDQPSQSGHDDHWLHNKLAILLAKYIEKKDAPAVERLNQLLPANYQRKILE